MYPKMGRRISQALCVTVTRPTAFDAQQASWRKVLNEGITGSLCPGEERPLVGLRHHDRFWRVQNTGKTKFEKRNPAATASQKVARRDFSDWICRKDIQAHISLHEMSRSK